MKSTILGLSFFFEAMGRTLVILSPSILILTLLAKLASSSNKQRIQTYKQRKSNYRSLLNNNSTTNLLPETDAKRINYSDWNDPWELEKTSIIVKEQTDNGKWEDLWDITKETTAKETQSI